MTTYTEHHDHKSTFDANSLMNTLVCAAIVVLLLLTIAWKWYGGSICRWIVLDDLSEYGRIVRRSDLQIEDKEMLLRDIYSLEDRVRDGRLPAYWGSSDEAIRQLLADNIDKDEVRLIVLELDRTRVKSVE